MHQRECEFILTSDVCFLISGFEIIGRFPHGSKCIFLTITLVKILYCVNVRCEMKMWY